MFVAVDTQVLVLDKSLQTVRALRQQKEDITFTADFTPFNSLPEISFFRGRSGRAYTSYAGTRRLCHTRRAGT